MSNIGLKQQAKDAIESACDWLCEASKGTDQWERGNDLRRVFRSIDAAVWQACMVQGLLGLSADSTPEQVLEAVKKLLNR